MRIIMQPIETIAWFKENGWPIPIRLKNGDNVIRVDKVCQTLEEKLAGNRMIIYRCQSEIDGQLRLFELKYELNTCKWYLWKM